MNKHFIRASIAVGLALCAGLVWAQVSTQGKPEVITVPLSRPGEPVTVEIEFMSARIEVIGEDRKDAQFSIVMGAGERRIKTPSGMKKLTGGGGALSIEEDDNAISVGSDTPLSGKVEIVARVPRRADLQLSTVNDGEIIVRDVTGALQLENVNGPITATNINGSVIAESVNDAINVAFSGIDPKGATAFSSLNGDLSLSLPANAAVELRIDSGDGQVESDFELDVKPTKPTIERNEGRGGVSVRVEDVIVATINGGGPVIRMKTLNGNVRIGKTGR